MKISDIMTEAPACIAPETTLQDAARRMKDLDVGALPICSDDRLVGMVTDRDLALRAVAEGCDPQETEVREVMTPGVVFCFEDSDITEAAQEMEQRQIRRLLVLSRNRRLVGIVSLGDIATRAGNDRLVGEVLERVSEPSHSGT